MKRISSYLDVVTDPSAGFSEGKLKDRVGDAPGSNVTAQTHNDLLYAFYALIKKYRVAGLSDADESEDNSDFVEAIEACVFNRSPLLTLTIEIGDWNMETTGSKAISLFALGIDGRTVRMADCLIRKDDDSERTFLMSSGDAGHGYGKIIVDQNNLYLNRTPVAGGGIFGAPNYDATGFNRGWVTIQYEP
jgi:hypothetical protein